MALAIATAVALLWFIRVTEARMHADALAQTNATVAQEREAEIAPVVRRLYAALAGDLAAPVIAWFGIKAIARRRNAGQKGH